MTLIRTETTVVNANAIQQLRKNNMSYETLQSFQIILTLTDGNVYVDYTTQSERDDAYEALLDSLIRGEKDIWLRD